MLRIGMPGMPPEPANAAPQGDDPPTDMDQDELGLPKLDPQATGYMGSEMGPFECEHCIYWEDPGSCHIVSGPIDPHGCCNLYVRNPDNTEEQEPEGSDQDQESGETPNEV